VDHDYANEEGFYSCANPMLLLKKNIIKANKELVILLDRPEQTSDVKERIKLLMSQLNTYQVITIIKKKIA
jgi:TusA-related sulfurtransferase